MSLPADLALLHRAGIPPGALEVAAALAERVGVPALEALLRDGLAEEETVYRALAAATGRIFVERPPIHPMARFPEAIQSGLSPLVAAPGGPAFVFAPRGRDFGELARRPDAVLPGFAITTPTRLREAVFAARGPAIARFAAEDLPRRRPAESYRDGPSDRQVLCLLVASVLLCGSLVAAGADLFVAATIVMSVPFLGLTAIKLAAPLERFPVRPPRLPARARERDLPVYSVLVPLFREGRILPRLLAALAALDYPAAKLDVKLLLEEGDTETADAVAQLRLPGFVEVVTAPQGEPRTKPRALNVALPLARGEYVVVFDAEDVPDPGQLRLAVSTFDRSEPDVACLQARLVIDNTEDGWLTRFFTVEYAALFDVVNPALVRFDLPMPLGGTSNHFRGIR